MSALRSSRTALFCAVVALAACSSDGLIDPDDRPDVPPADAFRADFSFFSNTPAAGGSTANWTLALGRIADADAEMTDVLGLPEAALRAAAAVSPARSGSRWIWPFSTQFAGASIDGELRSSIASGRHGWELFVTAPAHAPPLTNYLLAVGHSGGSGFEGQWIIADADAGSDEAIAAVSWALNAQDAVNFAFASSDTASWTYERSPTTNILTYTVYALPRYRVTWSPGARTGSTWGSQTDVTVCWDANLHDVAC